MGIEGCVSDIVFENCCEDCLLPFQLDIIPCILCFLVYDKKVIFRWEIIYSLKHYNCKTFILPSLNKILYYVYYVGLILLC